MNKRWKAFDVQIITGIPEFMTVMAFGIAIERELYNPAVKPGNFNYLK